MGADILWGRKLGIVGAGRMGEALLSAVIRADAMPAGAIIASDPDESRRKVVESLGVRAFESSARVVEESDIVVVAVKPQVVAQMLESVRPSARPDHLVISIAAGVPTERIESRLPEGVRVVRVMPNTPMQIGRGATALARGKNATAKDLEAAKALFDTSGLAVELTENQLDAVTAVSGTGPAYAFFLAECMIEAGVADGLEAPLARMLAAATLEGAGALLAASTEEPAELRRRVTSPGGTTEAAFKRLEEGGVREHFIAAVRRAAERSRELAAAGGE
ncbi:MAG: pyrroline-5-carboxylate reductase [Planctomycetota bacterium]|jgi:pyrroline-5-carboxylate reductase